MSSAAETVENASIISESVAHEGNRLWIGNIDPKITEGFCAYNKAGALNPHMEAVLGVVWEKQNFCSAWTLQGAIEQWKTLEQPVAETHRYHLVKLLEKFGKVKQFDFLFHKSGPLEGQPRGYCFVNFSTREEAERAIQCLNGKLALSKKLVVRWAHAQVRRFEGFRNDKTMPSSLEPSSSGASEDGAITTNHLSTSAKIRAIEAKLQMMEENPDDDYSGPSAYVYNKPPERKRWEPYSKSHHNNQSRPFRKFRR